MTGTYGFVVKEKMKKLKEKLKWWNKEVFGVLDLNIEKFVKDLNGLDDVAASGGVVDPEHGQI